MCTSNLHTLSHNAYNLILGICFNNIFFKPAFAFIGGSGGTWQFIKWLQRCWEEVEQKQKNKWGGGTTTTDKSGGGEEQAGSFSAWLRGGSGCLWTVRMDPFLQPLGGRGKKEKKAKGCCFGPPESQGKSQCFDVMNYGITTYFYHRTWEA